MTRRAAIVSAVRTPIGRYGGALSSIRPDDLAAIVIKEVVARAGIDPASIDDVYLGAANQAGEDNRNVARMSALLAGLPETVPGSTVNRLCASGLEAINVAARMIEGHCGDVMVAGGVESMSRAPFVMPKGQTAFDRRCDIYDTTIGWRFTNPKLSELYHPFSMGETAENVARKWSISREAQDTFAWNSQQKWNSAKEQGKWDEEVIPVSIPQRKGDPIIFDTDEHPRPDVALEKLHSLRPAFSKDSDATVTPGNSSGVNDGAAAVVLVEESLAKSLGLKILGYVGPCASSGVDPAVMGTGPIHATQKLFERTSLTKHDIDLFELNEAFAAQSIACIQGLELDESKVNVNGGAIALGHPLGCSGARLVVTLIHELNRMKVRRGIATLCVGVGQGLATLIEGEVQ
ncbi:MAG: acetyl-CoA C-acyltransferase [Phycisphaerae bacterium]|jgi:3-oxoadipyl-CoA thiolase|nr:acetyl-CoA C-acyltransferase [Phycisphaerae bacterium]MBT5409813.1 acetyl-CoA C-acyltransferase [Phycisphaerae bacterium]MBT6165358.1 acetyl-CoA C-acyltransferase [Phycisphaerae bacterium]MBT7656853.1 acetyl-CoA C-acyltransferase [Phycisphaerae bacterium]